MSEHGSSLGGRQMTAALPSCDRRGDLDGGDAGDVERIFLALTRVRDRTQTLPGSVTWRLTRPTAVEEVRRHLSDARG